MLRRPERVPSVGARCGRLQGEGAGSRRALDASPGVGASQEKHMVTSQAFKRVTWSGHAAWRRPWGV